MIGMARNTTMKEFRRTLVGEDCARMLQPPPTQYFYSGISRLWNNPHARIKSSALESRYHPNCTPRSQLIQRQLGARMRIEHGCVVDMLAFAGQRRLHSQRLHIDIGLH